MICTGIEENGGKGKAPKGRIAWIGVPGHMVKNHMTVIQKGGALLNE